MSSINLRPIERAFIRETAVAPRPWLAEAVERVTGLILFSAAIPVIATSAFAVAALSRRSPFVAHLRVGRHGRHFWVLKLRTMWNRLQPNRRERGWVEHIVADPGDDAKDPADPRVASRFAAFCRRHSIDEFPQLWHIARGEMSLVGPRPLTQSELDRHYGANSAELLSVKPGITGLWQVYGRSAIRFPERSAMDLELVRKLTPKLYLKILLRTLPALAFGKGAW